MEQAADAILQAAQEDASADELSDIEVDGDGSSSLSELDTNDTNQDEDGEPSDDHSNQSEDENDSEAETERLEESPNKIRTQKDVVLNSHNQTYERSPSKLHNQIIPDQLDDDDDDDPLSDDDMSIMDSPKSSVHHADPELPPAPTSLEESTIEVDRSLSVNDSDTRKRKRSIMAGNGIGEDPEEPLPKRTGSVLTPGDDYAIEDDDQNEEDQAHDDNQEDQHEDQHDEEVGTSNPISGTVSGEEGGDDQDEEITEEVEVPVAADEEPPEAVEEPVSPKKRGRKKKKVLENGVGNHDDEMENTAEEEKTNGDEEAANGDEENIEHEADDEVEAALRNEEERKFSHYMLPCLY